TDKYTGNALPEQEASPTIDLLAPCNVTEDLLAGTESPAPAKEPFVDLLATEQESHGAAEGAEDVVPVYPSKFAPGTDAWNLDQFFQSLGDPPYDPNKEDEDTLLMASIDELAGPEEPQTAEIVPDETGQRALETTGTSTPDAIADETIPGQQKAPPPTRHRKRRAEIKQSLSEYPLFEWAEKQVGRCTQSAPSTPSAPQGRSMIAQEGDHARDN
ncbi:MAG TPA: hypothetical protein VMU01_02645, partial [Rhizomicrobium sp.]|nr:hypothetical protein [Rhizomicrobium sp.]